MIPVTRYRDSEEQTTLKNRKSPLEVCMCGVSSQQWPSTQILCLKGRVRTQGSTMWWHQLPKSNWILVYWNTSFEGVQQPKTWWSPENPGNALSDAFLMLRFQNFAAAAGATKQNRASRGFNSRINELIIKLIRGQTFWEVSFFIVYKASRTSYKWSCIYKKS